MASGARDLSPLMKPRSIAVLGLAADEPRHPRRPQSADLRLPGPDLPDRPQVRRDSPAVVLSSKFAEAGWTHLLEMMRTGGLKAFLQARDNGFRPEPFGARRVAVARMKSA
jgi:hypothetical protein